MFGGAFWRGGRGGPLSLNPIPAPVSAEGITDTEVGVFDEGLLNMGPAKRRNRFARSPGTIIFLQVGVSSAREATFLVWGAFFV